MAYTNIDDPSAYFQSVLYTGNRTGGHAITNDGNSDLQPDLIWNKSSSYPSYHTWWDSSRGSPKYIGSNGTEAEGTYTGYLSTFDSDGFTLGGGDSRVNHNHEYVAWQWKANGGTTSSNTDGSITSTVQANQDAGFSIVTYTAPNSSGNFTAGHGLGVKPDMVITKSRSVAGGWWTWHKDLGQPNYYVGLHTNVAQAFEANIWGAGFDTSTIGLNVAASSQASQTYVAYCFAEKQGYSKFGSYVGNGNDNGPFVYTGFKPAWIMVKNIDSGVDHWHIIDNKRNPNNVAGKLLFADLTSAEITYTTEVLFDILSNGFKLRGDYDHINKSGENIIYMAFAENPFTTSTGIPTTAR